MAKNTLFRKGLVFAIIVLFATMSIISSTGSILKDRSSIDVGFSSVNFLSSVTKTNMHHGELVDSECYGFVIPLPRGNDSTYETFLNSKVRHLINDLLRENVTVYWSSCNFSVLSKEMDNNSNVSEFFYEKGDFIIPFSGDVYLDALTTAVIYDYNQTCEIEDENSIRIEVYKLMSPLDISAYELVEPKIAQHFGTPVRYGWPFYLQVVEAGGFLSMEFLLDNETADYLNNKDFNVFIWPYNPVLGTAYEVLKDMLNKDRSNAIRNFVQNGGGYIGSCYGAHVAASGFIQPLPTFSLRHAYNPNLSFRYPPVSFSISDSLMSVKMPLDKYPIYVSTSEIKDTDHPLSFGINRTVKDFFKGPWFVWLGRNTAEVATITNLTPEKNATSKPDFENTVIGTPSWVHSKFGNGKVVLFSSHPEFVTDVPGIVLFDYVEWEGDRCYGRRVIHNALFHVTSKGLEITDTNVHYNVSFVEELGEKTIDLSIDSKSVSEFDIIKTRIHRLNENISYLKNTSIELFDLFTDPAIENSSFRGKTIYSAIYMFYFCDIFSDFNNKTLSSINKLEQVYPMLLEFNDSVLQLVGSLKSDISWRLNHSEKLVSDVIIITNYLKDLLQHKRIFFQKLKIFREARHMLGTFGVGLKYIPQTYFETLKLLRYSWYNYEANTAIVF